MRGNRKESETGVGTLASPAGLEEARARFRAMTPAQHLAKQRLASASAAVDVGGVEEVHAGVKCRLHHRPRAFEVDTATEVVAAEPDHGHAEVADHALGKVAHEGADSIAGA